MKGLFDTLRMKGDAKIICRKSLSDDIERVCCGKEVVLQTLISSVLSGDYVLS